MKKLLLLALVASAAAEEVALVEVRLPGEAANRVIAIQLHEAEAPATVANFKKLARSGFYKGCAVHRAFPGVLIQAGDPLSKKEDRSKVGTGGPGYTLPAEIRRRHTKGAVAAARLPDAINPQRRSSGSQFFICLAPQPQYDGKQTVFGTVVQGLDIADRISRLPTDPNDNPEQRVELRRVRIAESNAIPAPVEPGEKKPLLRKLWPFSGR